MLHHTPDTRRAFVWCNFFSLSHLFSVYLIALPFYYHVCVGWWACVCEWHSHHAIIANGMASDYVMNIDMYIRLTSSCASVPCFFLFTFHCFSLPFSSPFCLDSNSGHVVVVSQLSFICFWFIFFAFSFNTLLQCFHFIFEMLWEIRRTNRSISFFFCFFFAYCLIALFAG